MAARTNHFVADRQISARDLAARYRERDQREASDTRSEIQKLMGDPPRDRSALSAISTRAPTLERSPASHPRVDLWRK